MTAVEHLHGDGPVTIDHVPGAGKTLVVSFASIGHDATRRPAPEFVGTATDQGRPALFVSDAARSWGLGIGFVGGVGEAIRKVCDRLPIDRIVAMGQSMGGTAALFAAAALPIDLVIAFGPQSYLGPDESRWQPWSDGLTLPPVPPLLPGQCRILMHGLADDHAQAMGFAPGPGTDHILFSGLTHSNLCPHLKQRGVLRGMLDSAIAGDRRRLLRIAASAGGQLRR